MLTDMFCPQVIGVIFLLLSGIAAGSTCKYDEVDQNCKVDGSPTDQVINGRPADNTQYPFLVAIQEEIFEGCFKHLCVGTMIAPKLVLTAAHCFDKFVDVGVVESWPRKPLYVAHNPKCRHQNNDLLPRVAINSIFIPEDYNRTSNFADLAIATLYGSSFPGELIDISPVQNPLPLDLKGLVVGYGIVRPEDKIDQMNVYPLQEGNLTVLDEQTTTCAGDSGGPFIIQQDGGIAKQIGVASWGPAVKCTSISKVQEITVFTRLSEFTDWIQSVAEANDQVLGQRDTSISDDASNDSTSNIPETPEVQQNPAADLKNQQQEEASALQAIKSQLSDETALQSWVGDNACTNWTYISCDKNNRVTKIQLAWLEWVENEAGQYQFSSKVQLKANTKIPDEFSVLEKLEYLEMRRMDFTGTIPKWMSLLTQLKVVDFLANDFTGTLSPEFSTWSQIKVFSVMDNKLTGSLPPEYSTMDKLDWFEVSKNSFSGQIPLEYSMLKAREISIYPQSAGLCSPKELRLQQNVTNVC